MPLDFSSAIPLGQIRPTVKVKKTTTGAPGTEASVVNVGTGIDVELEFVIPQGAQGPPGDVSAAVKACSDAVSEVNKAKTEMTTLSDQVKTEEGKRVTAETKRQTDTTAAIQAANAATTKALADGQEAKQIAQGAIDGLKADINATILDTAAPRLLLRVHGNPVVIIPAAGGRMTVEADKGCTVWLHGKNRWAKNTSKVVNGVTMSVASDGTVTLNGTATSAAAFRINLIMPLPGGVYTLSANNPAFGDASASSNSVRLSVGATGQSETAFNMLYLAEKNASKATTLTGVGYMQIVVSAGTTVSELTFKPQLEAGDTATSYEPCADSSHPLAANTPTEITAIPGTNHLYADNGAWLQVAYSPDSMAWVDETTVPVSAEGPVAQLKDCINGLPLDVVVRCVATQEGMGDPSPDNVRPIVPAVAAGGVLDLTRCRTQILKNNLTGGTTTGVTYTPNGDGTITLNGTSTGVAQRVISPAVKLVNGATYTLSSSLNGVFLQLSTYTTDNNYVGAYKICQNGVPVSFTYDKSALAPGLVLRLTVRTSTVGTVYTNAVLKPMLELGSVTNPVYEPHTGHTYPITLPEPVYGLPGAEDEVTIDRHGRVWWTKKAISLQFDGTESWSPGVASGNRYFAHTLKEKGYAPSGVAYDMWCNYFSAKAAALAPSCYIAAYGAQVLFYPAVGDTMTLEDWKTWVAAQKTESAPLQILYQLATPITTQIGTLTLPATDPITVYSDGGGDTTITGRMGVKGLFARLLALEDTVTKH